MSSWNCNRLLSGFGTASKTTVSPPSLIPLRKSTSELHFDLPISLNSETICPRTATTGPMSSGTSNCPSVLHLKQSVPELLPRPPLCLGKMMMTKPFRCLCVVPLSCQSIPVDEVFELLLTHHLEGFRFVQLLSSCILRTYT